MFSSIVTRKVVQEQKTCLAGYGLSVECVIQSHTAHTYSPILASVSGWVCVIMGILAVVAFVS
jgi:hypothetical protein